jgi:hypothetical protein
MKSYKQFINEKTEIPVDDGSIFWKHGIKDYTINSDGSIDVERDVYLDSSNLTKIPLKFKKVREDFFCNDNQLTSLVGSPINVGRNFDCGSNKLTSLVGSPINVGGNFHCNDNQLTSLVGCSENIGGDFYCYHNKINDFMGISEFFEGDLYCWGNPIYEIFKLFNNVKCIRWINEFGVIVDGKKVILDRLEEVFHQLDMVVPENIELPSYEII